ncbi:MAG TPA: fused MFS/spermidine synthase [Hyphomicrobiaceae bacterium]|nr:fused MFS/spermidine synthase [Hyphomicrobiaceae bacterium]
MPESNGGPGWSEPREPMRSGPVPGSLGASMLGDNGVVLWSYTATTFLSALLLFSIQPLFAKMVLPVLGGSPSVWAVAVFFFQAALLVGYCYAHVLIAKVPARTTGFIHLCVCVVALVCLPIGLPSGWSEPPPGQPYLWQIGLFTVAIGLPFLAVSANAPLLQAWFARTGHPHANDPYFLYAASNLGSLIALLAYPFVLEPAFGLKALSGFWAIGFALLIAAIGGVFMLMLQRSARLSVPAAAAKAAIENAAPHPTWADRLGWVGLALVPSALLTAFTTHVTTDVASAPLLWVLPLALYLLTFVLVFRDRSLIPRELLLALHLVSVGGALWVLSQTKHEGWMLTALTGVTVFFMSAMVAHRTLYEARPAARYLTEFYLWMALGGALGGLSAALIAPRVFSEVFEYPLLLALSMACRPGVFSVAAMRRAGGSLASLLGSVLPIPAEWKTPELTGQDKERLLMAWLLFAAGLLVIYWVPWAMPKLGIRLADWGTTPVVVGILVAVLVLDLFSPPRQLLAALLVFCALIWLPSGVKRGEAQRSYFGVYRVQSSGDGQYHTLIHGTTLHGAQRVRNDLDELVHDTKPATYYYEGSPMAHTIALVRERVGEGKGRYGVTGLGAGSLACHSKPGEAWRFFEIDPVVIGIASNPKNFTFLQSCQPKPDIVLGDARLTMAKEKNESFDLIIVDAFSSDAVPVHLMTAEAIRLYLDKVKENGIALLHISNRYLDLDSVLGATIKAVPGAHGLIISDDTADGSYAQSTSTVALFAKSEEALEPFRKLETVMELDANGLRPWTDDYSDILGPFMTKRGYKWGTAE